MLQNNTTLKSKIQQLWDKFWSGGISNPLTAIEQITYLLFMKRLDDLDLKRIADAEFTGDPYTSKFDGTFTLPGTKKKVDKQTLRWSHFKQRPAAEMLEHVQTKVFPFLKTLKIQYFPACKMLSGIILILPIRVSGFPSCFVYLSYSPPVIIEANISVFSAVRRWVGFCAYEYLQFALFWYATHFGFKNVMSKATIAHLTGEKLKETQIPLPPPPAPEPIRRNRGKNRSP